MINKNDILKFVKHVHRRDRGVPDRRPIYPRRDWLIGVVLCITLMVGAMYYSVVTFSHYQLLDQQSYEVSVDIPKYNEPLVKTVLQHAGARKETYEALLNATEPLAPIIATTSTSTLESEEGIEVANEEAEARATTSEDVLIEG